MYICDGDFVILVYRIVYICLIFRLIILQFTIPVLFLAWFKEFLVSNKQLLAIYKLNDYECFDVLSIVTSENENQQKSQYERKNEN